MSSKRRYRILQKWNNLKCSDFTAKPGVSRHTALRDMCSLASSIQLQFGTSYQGDQHLRDTLMNACKNELWSQRLATMPTNRLLDIKESPARAVTAKEKLESSKRKVVPAFANEVSLTDYLDHVNFNKNRSRLPYRKYGSGKLFASKFSTPTRKAISETTCDSSVDSVCQMNTCHENVPNFFQRNVCN